MDNREPTAAAEDVQTLMERIRRRIEEKKKSGLYAPEDVERIEKIRLEIKSPDGEEEGDLSTRLSRLSYLCDTARPPEFRSHRRILGPLVQGIKMIVRRLTEPYVQMIFHRQVEFNRELTRLLNQMILDTRFHRSEGAKRLAEMDQALQGLARSLETFPRELQAQKNAFEEVLARLKALGERIPERALLEDLQERVREPEYARFEDLHRGSEEDIRWKQKRYLPYFRDRGLVLDIGCGRGEFLELLQEESIPAIGVDTNREMVERCRNKGLQAVAQDGLRYLKDQGDESLGGVFLGQVIEHLDPEDLREWVRTAFVKLRAGGVLLAETINPQCLSTFSGAFYLDLSHKKPVHPEAARFLWRSLGFREVEILYVSPYPEEMKLKEMVRLEDDSYEDELARLFNENMRALNALLYGHQDYAVVGYK